MPTDPATPAATEAREALSLTVIVPVYNEEELVAESVGRVLALDHPRIASLQVIAVDDRSTDRSPEILARLAEADDRLTVLHHAENQGKGGAIQTGLKAATGDVTVCHDADLEYNPADLPSLLVPFLEEGADAVFGSRYMAAPYRRVLMHRHSLMNKGLTLLGNWITDLHLSDLETCYKAVRTPLFQSISLESRDFRVEVELAFKLAHRKARLFEVPIRYTPRGFKDGKKIRPRDGVLALYAMGRYARADR